MLMQVDHFVKIYPGVWHGWIVGYRDDDITAVIYAQEAQQNIVDLSVKRLQITHPAL